MAGDTGHLRRRGASHASGRQAVVKESRGPSPVQECGSNVCDTDRRTASLLLQRAHLLVFPKPSVLLQLWGPKCLVPPSLSTGSQAPGKNSKTPVPRTTAPRAVSPALKCHRTPYLLRACGFPTLFIACPPLPRPAGSSWAGSGPSERLADPCPGDGMAVCTQHPSGECGSRESWGSRDGAHRGSRPGSRAGSRGWASRWPRQCHPVAQI